MLIAELHGDFLHLHPFNQHGLGLLHLLVHDELLKRDARHLLEQVRKIALAKVDLLRHLLQRQAGVQIGANVGLGLLDNPGGFNRTLFLNPAAALGA
ncbi:hypothetical protein D3C85_1579360 [compost metagenome]